MIYLLDSVILIDHFNGIPVATSYLQSVWRDAAISAITRAEVLTGFDDGERPQAMELLVHFSVLAIDAETADIAASLRREFRWKLPDALQAAVATRHGLRLVTRNTKDFPPERFGFVDVPYRV